MEAIPMRPFIKFLFVILLCNYTIFSSHGQYVTIDGRQFKDEHDSNFYPVVCNYVVNFFYTDDTSTFYVSPQCDGEGYECDGTAACDTQFFHNFKQIKHMGFNAIRLFGAGPVYWGPIAGIDSGFRIDANHSFDTVIHRFFLHSPYSTDPNTQRIFALVDRILLQADHAGLKVILLAAGAKGRYYPYLDTLFYPEYLSALSYHIANNSPQTARNALMAYDLLNEPASSNQTGWPWDPNNRFKKNAICTRVSNWYNATKVNDPNHLITMGAGGVNDDILEYDLSVMKLDFASPHIYPGKTTYELDSMKLQYMINRIHGLLYWLGKNSQMPFLIGETGFSAQENVPDSLGTDGNTLQQKQYADSTLQLTRDCLGSGYSWWKYQNSYWHNSNYQDFLGLLNGGICNTPCISLEKPVVKAFENFSSTDPHKECKPPTNYFNPWNLPISYPDSNIIHGIVKDKLTGKPIRDAVVFGTSFQNWNGLDSIVSYKYTFTDSLGNFRMIPYNFTSPTDTTFIHDLYITAPGAERLIRQIGSPWPPYLIDNENYELTQRRWDFDGELTNVNIHTNEVENLQGWNSLSLTAVKLDSGSFVNINARREINIDNEFEALTGSEVLVECLSTFPICTDFEGFQKKSTFSKQETNSKVEISDIEIDFHLSKNALNFTAFPNPSNGNFIVNVLVSVKIEVDLKVDVVNFLGVSVINMVTKETTFSIDMSSALKGLYLMKISTSDESQTKKIIIN
ncbi:MAG: T9SS type A sorting domain-containing protein [Bacteroidetes bacterium]|nr:T9SS type A sorting domain-containing protein [Bacteroidota bacterium]